ncbi:phosphatase PAP2 family protein [Kribbella sp.]|uniref:phosphatase PAP2 family protein n=1 Tax=Kribbella sp. TaxID=1871183 RepID=UPI002D33BBB2|nr:phosphatase PAP2 family protein [Kribbella sp.]HZX07111.1 phosphatase PAP2 family protein [Kribbella sp.]
MIGLGVFVFVATLLDLVTIGVLRSFDHYVIPVARPAGEPSSTWWQALADIGGVGVLTVVLVGTAVLHLYRRRPIRQLVRAAVWIAIVEAVIWLTKLAVGRTPPRSHVDRLADGGMSWPSGHTADSLALLLIAVTLLTTPGTRLDRFAVWAVPVVSAGVAVATVHLHYHWPTDTLGGWSLGLALGLLARRSLR